MDEKTIDCPCKRTKCERYGDCGACRKHHAPRKTPPACGKRQADPHKDLSKKKQPEK